MRIRQFVAFLLATCLAFPVAAAPARPAVVGLTVSANSAQIGNAVLRAGATVFSGDRLRVEPSGSAVLASPGEFTLNFTAGTWATLGRAGDGAPATVDLQCGRLAFHVQRNDSLEILVEDAVIRGSGSGPAKALVALVSPERALVGAELGEITVSTLHDARSVTLRAGDTVEVTLVDKTAAGAPAAGAVPTPQATEPVAKSASGKRTALIGVIVAGGISALLLMASVGLSRNEHQDLVSPFRLP